MTEPTEPVDWISKPYANPYDREGLPSMSSLPDYMQELEKFRRGIKDAAHRRLYACRLSADLREIVSELATDDQTKTELTNLVNVTLRLILIEDDNELSKRQLRAF